MASLSLSFHKHSLPSLLPRQSPKALSSSHNLIILPKSSHSQFYGVKLSSPSSVSLPSSNSSSRMTFIFAKVLPFFVLPHLSVTNITWVIFCVYYWTRNWVWSIVFYGVVKFSISINEGKQRWGASKFHIERSRRKECDPLQIQRKACSCLLLPCWWNPWLHQTGFLPFYFVLSLPSINVTEITNWGNTSSGSVVMNHEFV